MLVLPVARDKEPLDKKEAISSFDLTSGSVTPASVIPPVTVSLICIGTRVTGLSTEALSPLFKFVEFASSRSNTSSLNIYK